MEVRVADFMSGREALEKVEALVASWPDTTQRRRPSWDVIRAVAESESLMPGLLSAQRELEGVYSAGQAARLSESLHMVGLLTHATRYTCNEDERAGEAERKRRVHIENGWEARPKAFELLALMEGLRLVAPQAAAAIRAGTGVNDLAGDLQVIAGLGLRHWPTLAPIQALRPVEETWSEAELRGWLVLANDLMSAEKVDPNSSGDRWRGRFVGCVMLLEEHWERVRLMASTAYRLLGQADKATPLRSLGALGHS
jgi:hypothetical protein